MDDEYEDSDAQFLDMVKYFWDKAEDPTRYAEWSETRFMKLNVTAWNAWRDYKMALKKVNTAMEQLGG